MYKKSLGLIIPSLVTSQLAFFAIHRLNNISYNTHDIDCVAFVENVDKPCVPNLFSIMEMTQIWNFHGTLISTTLENASFAINATTNAKKIFYIWDLEWLRGKKNFKNNLSILRNPNINLATRSKDYADLTYNYCGIMPRVVEHFDVGAFL